MTPDRDNQWLWQPLTMSTSNCDNLLPGQPVNLTTSYRENIQLTTSDRDNLQLDNLQLDNF